MTSTLNGWYLGNIVFGGLIGILIVDPLTGAMFRFDQKSIDRVLAPETAGVLKNDGGFVILLKSEIPADLVGTLEEIPAS